MPISKILIVDDSPAMQRIVINTLNSAGYHDVVAAATGREAIEKLKSEPGISAILSDWNMPEMTGIELLKVVRANPSTQKLPFILVTSRHIKEDILMALKLGANDYVTKPFDPDTIKKKLARL